MEMTGDTLLITGDGREFQPREFSGNASLVSVKVLSHVREIPEQTFKGCPLLKSVEFAEGLEVIGFEAFCDCPKLKCVKLPPTIKQIAWGAFGGCSALEEIVLPEGLRQVGRRAFAGCNNIKEVSLPSSLVNIGCEAFMCCKGLERVDVHPNIRCSFRIFLSDDGAMIFRKCSAIREVIIHEGVTAIPSGMFYECGHIETIQLPSTLKCVKEKAFNAYVGRPIVLPEGVDKVEDHALGEYDSGAIGSSRNGIEGFRALKFENGGRPKVIDFIVEGERRLAEDTLDTNEFCRWLLNGPDVSFEGHQNDNSAKILLKAMKGHSRLLRGSTLARATDETISVWMGLVGYAVLYRDAEQEAVTQFFGEILRQNCRDEASQRRKIAIVENVLSGRQIGMKASWDKPAGRGRLSPMLEAISLGNAELRRDFESIWKLTKCPAIIPKGDLREAAEEGRFYEFMLKLPMYGLEIGWRVIAMLFKYRFTRCILAAYKNNKEFENQIPLKTVLLAVCQNWPTEKASEFVKCVEEAFPGICANTFDAASCDPLWHCLYNCDSPIFLDRSTLVSALIDAGCNPGKKNRFGLSVDDIRSYYQEKIKEYRTKCLI